MGRIRKKLEIKEVINTVACLISGQKMRDKLVNLLIKTNGQEARPKDESGDKSKNGNE